MSRGAQIQAVVNAAKPEIFTADYAKQASDAEVLGLLIGRWAEWDGETIVETLVAALEEANYHGLCEQIEELWKQVQEEDGTAIQETAGQA